MTDQVIGRGTIELIADARKLKAGIEEAKRATRTLGEGQREISRSAQQSIDRYIRKLQQQNATIGKSVRETELYKLALRGASNEQLNAANAALKAIERHKQLATIAEQARRGLLLIGAAAVTGAIAAAAAFDQLVKRAGSFQDLAEKIGDSAEAVASLAVSAAVGGSSMDEVGQFAIRLTKNLTGVDDESKNAGAAIKALGLDLDNFKKLNSVDQIEAIAKALNKFSDEGTGKTAVLESLAKGGAQLLPFLKELGQEGGRQTILTKEQIRLADEYADKQAKVRAQIGLQASAIASAMLPAYADLQGSLLDVIKSISGVQGSAKGLRDDHSIQDFAEDAARSVAFTADAFDGLIRISQLAGKTLAATIAAGNAAMRLDFTQALSIGQEAAQDRERILMRPTFQGALEDRIAARKAAAKSAGSPSAGTDGRPGLHHSGAKTDGKNAADTIAQEAKAQLAFDLDQIKKASEAQVNTFSNAERIMEALRSASRINEQEYFEAKRGFLLLNTQEQARELAAEIARLEQEKVTGKDRIDNDRKIAAARAQLAKVEENAAAQAEVLNIQQKDSVDKITRAYLEASTAATDYINTIKRQNARDIAGIGRGNRFRDEQSGINAIEDKLIAERRRLETERRLADPKDTQAQQRFDQYLAIAERTYQQEIDLYLSRTDTIRRAESDWTNGAREALSNYADDARNVAKQTEEVFTSAFQSAEDSLVEFAKTGKTDLRSLIDEIHTKLLHASIRQGILGPLAEGLKGILPSGAGGFTDIISSVLGGGKNASSAAATASMTALSTTTATTTAAMTTLTASASAAAAALSAVAATSGVSSAAGAVGDLEIGDFDLSDAFTVFDSFATGTEYVPRTGPYLLHKGESVLTERQTAQGLGGAGMTVNNHFTISAPVTRETQDHIARKVGLAAQRAIARNS